MKKAFVILMAVTMALPALAKEDWKGKVVDGKGEPLAYANVAILSQADSTVVCGVVTREDGTFNIATNETGGIMMVALLGYKTVYLTPSDGAVITLADDVEMLVEPFLLEGEDVLHQDDAVFAAGDLADLHDLARAVRQTGLLDDQMDRRGNLFADRGGRQLESGHHDHVF